MKPLLACLLFCGRHTRGWRILFFLLGALLLFDLWTGFYTTLPVVYGCLFLTFFLGRKTIKHNVFGMVVASSTLFFVITNGAVWLIDKLYPATFAGLVRCYTLALPFWRAELMADLLLTVVLWVICTVGKQFARHSSITTKVFHD